MKIKEGFVLRKVAGSFMVVPIGENAAKIGGLMSLNETAADIWRLVEKEDRSEEEIAQILSNEYDAPVEEIREAVQRFSAELQSKGIAQK